MKRSEEKKHGHKKHSSELRKYLVACAIVIIILAAFSLAAFLITEAANQSAQPPQISYANTATSTPPGGPDAYAHVSLIAKAAIVYDLTDGQILYQKNAFTPLPLASVTKLLTLYAATEVLSPSSTVTMTPDSVTDINDTADTGFKAGQSFTFEDLARLTLAASSNNGAQAIADAADEARGTTVQTLLANAAATLGLTQITATNPTGLDISDTVSGAYGSAHDIAVLAGALLKKARPIAEATTQPVVSVTSSDGVVHTFANTDLDVTHIPDPLLSKTGYTDLAGGNLVVVYDAGINHPIAVVVLGSTENGRFTDVQQLVNATLAHFGGVKP
jgi:D-alanyl-D-alanine carboxypeptidase